MENITGKIVNGTLIHFHYCDYCGHLQGCIKSFCGDFTLWSCKECRDRVLLEQRLDKEVQKMSEAKADKFYMVQYKEAYLNEMQKTKVLIEALKDAKNCIENCQDNEGYPRLLKSVQDVCNQYKL